MAILAALFLLFFWSFPALGQPGFPIRHGQACGGDLGGTFPDCTVKPLQTDNLGVEFEESDTNPACNAGDYFIYADLSDLEFKKCENGTVSAIGSGAGGTSSLQDAFDGGKTITGANSLSNAVKICGSSVNEDCLSIYQGTFGMTTECQDVNGDPCDQRTDVPTNKSLIFSVNGTTFESYNTSTSPATHAYAGDRRPFRRLQWPAAAMYGDGTECDTDPTTEDIAGVPSAGIRCPMTTSETDGVIYGVPLRLEEGFDRDGGIDANMQAWLVTDSGAATVHGRFAVECVAAGEAPSIPFGNAVQMDFTVADADVVDDEVRASTGSTLDVSGTDADCQPGDTLYWRFIMCDTDATPSTGCTSNAGVENDLSVFLVEVLYRVTSDNK